MSKLIRFILPIPCSNYTNVKNVPQERNKLVEWAIMDTFDALGAKYDKPLTFGQLKNIVKPVIYISTDTLLSRLRLLMDISEVMLSRPHL